MPRLVAILILLGVSPAAGAQASFAIVHVTVIDVIRGIPEPNRTVIVTNNIISRVGTASDVHPPDGVQVIDAIRKVFHL